MTEPRDQQIELAKNLLKTVRHAAMATVNEDGTPHNTPFFFMYDSSLTKVYWGSHPNSQHSKNVASNPEIFVVVYDSHSEGKGGLYITAQNAHVLYGKELSDALKIHNSFRAKYNKNPLDESYYIDGEQRMYGAEIKKIEVYHAQRGKDGMIINESRMEVDPGKLIGDIGLNCNG